MVTGGTTKKEAMLFFAQNKFLQDQEFREEEKKKEIVKIIGFLAEISALQEHDSCHHAVVPSSCDRLSSG